jgi:thiamine pyrophosphokinase
MAGIAHALVVADGDVEPGSLAALVAGTPGITLIGADGGAGRVLAAGLVPDLVIGDLDSLSSADRLRLEALGVEIRVAARDKDESDMELSLLAALEAGARDITIVGALGLIRPEHGIANVHLLAHPVLDGAVVTIVGRGTRLSRIGTEHGPGERLLEGSAGDYVSLLPLDGAVQGVTTEGLRFLLAEATLPLGPTRGLSNRMTGTTARVTCRSGRLLIVQTDASAESRASADDPVTDDPREDS